MVLVEVMQRYHPNSLFDGGTSQNGQSATVFCWHGPAAGIATVRLDQTDQAGETQEPLKEEELLEFQDPKRPKRHKKGRGVGCLGIYIVV